MAPLVFLTLPLWSHLFVSLPRLSRGMLLAGLVGAAQLHLFASQAAWLSKSEPAGWFNRPETVFRAWSFLEQRPDVIVLSDDLWTNLWTPAKTGKVAWIGHPHETPEYQKKYAIWSELFSTRERDTVRFTLQTIPVTHLLLTSKTPSDRMARVTEGEGWEKVFQDDGVMVLERKK